MPKRKVSENTGSSTKVNFTPNLKQRQSKLNALAVVCNQTALPTRYSKRIGKPTIDDLISNDTAPTTISTKRKTNVIDNFQVYVQLEDIAFDNTIHKINNSQYQNFEVYVKLEDIALSNKYALSKKLKTETISVIKNETIDADDKATVKKLSSNQLTVKKDISPIIPKNEIKLPANGKKEKRSSPVVIGNKKTNSTVNYPEIPVDKECTTLFGLVHVFCEGNAVYGVMLNQTNLQYNNNKFYLIQLLKHKEKTEYYVWMRWARVGRVGQTKLSNFGNDLESAKDCFSQKFFDKTRNYWDDRSNFAKVHGKYDLVYIDYSKKPLEDHVKHEEEPCEILTVIESKLEQKIQDLIRIFFDVREMNSAVAEMKYDANKVPLGRLSEVQIRAGYMALRQIEGLINEGYDGKKKLIQACNDYYTRVPHDFGMRVPPVICSIQEIKRELELLETLSDIKIALSLLHRGGASDIHSFDKTYNNMKCDIMPISSSDPVYQMMKNYLEWTHGATHSSYTLELLDLFSVRKDQEWSNFEDCGNRMLLWHGSRTTNYAGILSQGLRIAPREAPLTGHMFGKGVYFTDTSSKSANYVYSTRSKNEGFLLLCEVALGTLNELVRTDERAHRLPHGCHSVKGLGMMSPDQSTWTTMDDGVVVPLGVLLDTGLAKKHKGYVLNYNEYIVYRTSQIKMRYLLKVRFNYK